jgi:hypothetical protein
MRYVNVALRYVDISTASHRLQEDLMVANKIRVYHYEYS